jgi:formamidopyrimidine-DNA glycosylase
MPELPEVETVRAGLELLLSGAVIASAIRYRADLRTPLPRDLAARLRGRRVLAVNRRAKYLLIATDGPTLLSHLGMTGVWRLATGPGRLLHDHVELHLGDGRRLLFSDPRRFGLLEFCRADGGHRALDGLGPEPMGPLFTPAALAAQLARHRRAAIKALIMDQKVVVGVGNIYAAESLFRAGIRPTIPAGRLRPERIVRLVAEIRNVLGEAIAAGGSSIDDFYHVNGLSGRFQHRFAVYGREGQPCQVCATPLVGRAIAGRASVWCPVCQC